MQQQSTNYRSEYEPADEEQANKEPSRMENDCGLQRDFLRRRPDQTHRRPASTSPGVIVAYVMRRGNSSKVADRL
jgi:hypothetical protein